MADASQIYNRNAESYSIKYESTSFEQVHGDWISLVPTNQSLILDIGAGSGRDAAWFAEKGHEVVAVEPADGMLTKAKMLHPNSNIVWLKDSLPDLKEVQRLYLKYDLILLSAVWQHVPLSQRDRSFRKIVDLLKPSGKIVITLRYGPSDDDREFYKVSNEEIVYLANKHGLLIQLNRDAEDSFRRDGIKWSTLVLNLPDDGTGALPLLRHIIINDVKSSTYKLALLRTLARVADGAHGMVIKKDDEYVHLPFGIVSLYWLKMYKKLIMEFNYPQHPAKNKLGFDKTTFRMLSTISDFDLRIGARFTGNNAKHIQDALKIIQDTIQKMPVFYTKYPNSDKPVFKYVTHRVKFTETINLDFDFLTKYGTFKVPINIWEAMSRYTCWIEPSIINNWCELMATYDKKGNTTRTYGEYAKSLEWMEEQRNTLEVRNIVDDAMRQGKTIRCAWSQKRLGEDYAIDHCFPFSYWPNNDLWNLLPSDKKFNSRKLNKLPSARLLEDVKEVIFDWWTIAYSSPNYQQRFINEAMAALPTIRTSISDDVHSNIFSGMHYQRIRLKMDQQIKDWDG
jgi:SAM-dependent methyltransferase